MRSVKHQRTKLDGKVAHAQAILDLEQERHCQEQELERTDNFRLTSHRLSDRELERAQVMWDSTDYTPAKVKDYLDKTQTPPTAPSEDRMDALYRA